MLNELVTPVCEINFGVYASGLFDSRGDFLGLLLNPTGVMQPEVQMIAYAGIAFQQSQRKPACRWMSANLGAPVAVDFLLQPAHQSFDGFTELDAAAILSWTGPLIFA